MAETDHSFFDNFSDHLQSTLGQQAQGLSQLKIENAKMNSNKNLSGETKTVANVLDAVDAGVQAFGLVTGAVDGVVESALVTTLSGLGLKGMACLLVAIQLSPVAGYRHPLCQYSPITRPCADASSLYGCPLAS